MNALGGMGGVTLSLLGEVEKVGGSYRFQAGEGQMLTHLS